MVVGFTTTCSMSVYHHESCEFKSCSWRGVLNTTLYDNVCQWLATGHWFSPGTPVSCTNKTDRLDIAEILLNTLTLRGIVLSLPRCAWLLKFALTDFLHTLAMSHYLEWWSDGPYSFWCFSLSLILYFIGTSHVHMTHLSKKSKIKLRFTSLRYRWS